MSRPISDQLTPSQHRVARVLAEFARAERPAFVPDLVAELKLAGESSLTRMLQKMARGGFVVIQGGGVSGRSRLVQLTAKARYILGIGGLPLLGVIPTGPLSEAVAQAGEIIEADKILPHRRDDFLLRVRGDSMTGDGIHEGDLVLLRPNGDVPNGAVAAVCVGDDREATLKRVFYEGEQVRLRASNPAYKDIVVRAENVHFAGLLKGVVRHV